MGDEDTVWSFSPIIPFSGETPFVACRSSSGNVHMNSVYVSFICYGPVFRIERSNPVRTANAFPHVRNLFEVRVCKSNCTLFSGDFRFPLFRRLVLFPKVPSVVRTFSSMPSCSLPGVLVRGLAEKEMPRCSESVLAIATPNVRAEGKDRYCIHAGCCVACCSCGTGL